MGFFGCKQLSLLLANAIYLETWKQIITSSLINDITDSPIFRRHTVASHYSMAFHGWCPLVPMFAAPVVWMISDILRIYSWPAQMLRDTTTLSIWSQNPHQLGPKFCRFQLIIKGIYLVSTRRDETNSPQLARQKFEFRKVFHPNMYVCRMSTLIILMDRKTERPKDRETESQSHFDSWKIHPSNFADALICCVRTNHWLWATRSWSIVTRQ